MAAASWGLHLPEEVLIEFMSRLPVKSLLRFSDSVLVVRSIRTEDRRPENQKHQVIQGDFDSKMVLSLLSNQTQTTTPTPIPLIDIDMEVSSPSSHMFLASHNGDLHVCGPCNGIVCITNRGDIVLCNPSTREFKTLPLPPFSYPRDMLSRVQAVGFGFDSSSNDYKVVRIVRVHQDIDDVYEGDPEFYCPDYINVEIYNLSTDSWREVDTIMPINVYVWYPPRFEMLFNGAFHWYGMKRNTNHGVGNVDNFESIICFDINDEVFRLIQLPDVCSYMDGKHRSLLVFNESLAVILFKGDEYFDIWVMDEYGVKESWTKQFSIGPLVGINFPLAFWKDGSELLMESSSGQLVSCDLRTQDTKKLQVHGVIDTLRVLPYTESLTSIKNCNQLNWQMG